MPEKRRKRKRKSKPSAPSAPGTPPSGVRPSSSSGGGLLQSIRTGFRRAAGVEKRNEKPSTLSNVIWTIILLAALGLLLYRFYGS